MGVSSEARAPSVGGLEQHMWCIYSLELSSYVGSTPDLKRRFESHKKGQVLSTKAYGCHGVFLDTHSFQAPDYKKHDYKEFGRLEDFPPGHLRIWLSKML